MDLPKKYSSRYVTWVYAFFIILFAITLSLFFISRRQISIPSPKQETDLRQPPETFEKSPIVKKKIDRREEQALRKYEASKSGNEAFDAGTNAEQSKKKLSDEPKIPIDDSKRPPG